MKIAIFGAGLAGLSSAYELSKRDVDVTVLEICPEVGGLAKSFTKKGFTYDLGPHRFHSKKKEIISHLKEVMKENLDVKKRLSHIYLKNKLFSYPLDTKNVLINMPLPTTFLIITDYLYAQLKGSIKKKSDKSFKDWVINRFGKKLYNIYFKPYTEKSWGLPCSRISSDWAVQRITLLNLWDAAVKTLFKPKDIPRTLVSKFYYPKRGGIGQIVKNYEKYINNKGNKVLTNAVIKRINLNKNNVKSITYSYNNKEYTEYFDYVFSTIPLNVFVNLIEPKPSKDVLKAVSKLKFRSIIFAYLILNKDILSKNHWIYLPEKKFLSNRLSEFKNFSMNSSVKGKTIVCGEISCNYNDGLWNKRDEDIIKGFMRDVKELGLAKKNDLIESFVHRIEHSYPLYTLDYKPILNKVFDYLDNVNNLYYYGRNAMFRYNNMDQSVDMGIDAARSLFDKKFKYKDIATEKKWFG